MRAAVDEVLIRYGGVASRCRLLEQVPAGELDDEVRGAQASVGSPVALSHLTGLHRWGLLDERPEAIHVSVPAQRVLRPQAGLAVHRVARFPTLHRVGGLVTTCVAASVVDSWSLQQGRDQRASAIAAVRTGAATPRANSRSGGTPRSSAARASSTGCASTG